MGKVIISIDWMDHNFGAAPLDECVSCVATGKTLSEVESAIVEALQFHLEGMQRRGERIPEEFLGEWTPEFVLTTRALLRYADNYITRKALSKETGINEQQLSHYANGQRHPRPQMQRRIAEGLGTIVQHLSSVL